MGRKPNALILAHFVRGAKLNDSSNRYAHTCKHCGEKFPKGRIDSLTNHLVKKCNGLTERDRQTAVLEMHNMPQPYNLENMPDGAHLQVPMNGPTVQLPIGGQGQPWTALGILAEVSKQMDPDRDALEDRSVHNRSVGAGSRSSVPPRPDRLELQEQYTLDNPPVSYEQRVQRDKKLNTQKTSRRESELSLPNFGQHMPSSRPESPNLAMAASSMAAAAAASRFVPHMTANMTGMDERIDPQLLDEDVNTQQHPLSAQKSIEQALSEAHASFSEHLYQQGPGEQRLTWPMVDGSGGTHFGESPVMDHNMEQAETPRAGVYSRLAVQNAPSMTTEFSAEYGNGQKADKPKVRGKFNPERRKEVQAIRKKGACFRCRMLKKPCSEGEPCVTCKSVESARLWKTPCTRKRLTDEMQMYSASLHAVLASQAVNATKSQHAFLPSLQQIEASHYPETAIFITFKSFESHEVNMAGIDPGLAGNFSANTLRVLDESEDMSFMIENYTKRMAPTFFKHEPSRFMNTTLMVAQQLVNTPIMDKRDTILSRALDLWAVVHILVDHEMTWNISVRVNNDAQEGEGPAIEQKSDNDTYSTLCLQLNAAAERRAANLCKSILGDLERRLLVKVTGDMFETFLAAVIVLNCVEKSTWLFKSWEQDSFKARWPLQKTPVEYSKQGESLTELLGMVLKVRNVPPKLKVRHEDGVLMTDSSQFAAEYFQKLQLTHDDLLSKQANHRFDPANSRCFELHLISRLLLPID